MERGKGTARRNMKVRGHLPTGDFIALGSKPRTTSEVVETKLPVPPQRKGSLPSTAERKREAPSSSSSSSGISAKKTKIAAPSFSFLARVNADSKEADSADAWESLASEIESTELLTAVLSADDKRDEDRVDALLCGAVKTLKTSRTKPDAALYLTLLYLARNHSSFFTNEPVTEAFCSLLKRDITINFKVKSMLSQVLACNTLMSAYQLEENWSLDFVKVYVEDALGDRIWVDHEECKSFVDNILTGFNTKMPNKLQLPLNLELEKFTNQTCPSPPVSSTEDDERSMEITSFSSSTEKQEGDTAQVFPRYVYTQEAVENYVLDVIREQVNRRQAESVSRNLLRLLTATCGIADVRLMVAQRLEMWLQNPKLTRPAQELLMSVCINCNQHHQQDVEVISHLIKIRLKPKPLITHFLASIRELLGQHPDNISTILKHTIYNELSTSRNPNNMAVLHVIFQHTPEDAARLLAEVFQDLLTNRDDYLRALRALLREIVRSLRYEINFSALALGLMQERDEQNFKDLDVPLKERLLISLTDLITLCIFLAITPAVREAASACVRGDKRDMEILRNYRNQVAIVQRDSIWWLHTVVPKMFTVTRTEYVHCLHKVLFMEQAEHYYNKDNWPPESERPIMLRLASEAPVLDDALMRVLIIGLSKELPLNAPDSLELADQMVRRAASLYNDDTPVLKIERLEIIDVIFNLCAYHHPENIQLPQGYQPPTLAISNLYWKAWIFLLILAAHNPTVFGRAAWDSYPILKCFMEMAMTNHFIFPPPTTSTDGKTIDEIRNRELQIAQLEKQEILEFESHLAAASSKVAITESNSLLLSQLTTMDPSGVARRAPSQVLEQLKVLNQSLKIGHLLCRSRSPDFLLDIIQQQGTSQSMPWLAELVESSEGPLDLLPVQCLCEFLLHETLENKAAEAQIEEGKEETKTEKVKRKQKQRKHQQLLDRLHLLLHDPNGSPDTVCEVLNYFLKRLTSQQTSARVQATQGLVMVLSQPESSVNLDEATDSGDTILTEDDNIDGSNVTHKWLLKQMPSLPHFESLSAQASIAIRQACQIETDPAIVSAYIQYLSKYAPDDQLQDLDEVSLDMAQLIVERATIMGHILAKPHPSKGNSSPLHCMLVIFSKYLCKAREPEREAYTWSDTQDQILVEWSSGEAANMHILVVHAMIILLTFGKPPGESSFDELIEIWFPENAPWPSAFLVDTSEEALLLPDWLKLRMIQSSVPQLVDAALKDLDPSQLVLFVQSFGIPLSNMSKLLQHLDEAVELDKFAVDKAVMDKNYMAQIVEVQKLRGAEGGDKFQSILKDTGEEQPEPMEMELSIVDQTDTGKLKRSFPRTFLPTRLIALTDTSTVLSVLMKLFLEHESVSIKERLQFFRVVQKEFSHAVCRNEGLQVVRVIITALNQILRIPEAIPFVNGLHKFNNISYPLFRLILSQATKNEEANNAMSLIFASIIQCSHHQNSPFLNLLKQHFKVIKSKVTSHQNLNTVIYLTKANEMEKAIKLCITESIQKNQTKSTVTTICQMLLQDSITQGSLPKGCLPVLLDCLANLEPEIISSHPDFQQEELLFSKEVNTASTQPYFLSLLTHQGSWKTLHHCISLLLKYNQDRFKSSTVLDFLWACIHIPKIWQGRELRLPKHYEGENILHLNAEQVCQVVDYILNEGLEKYENGSSIEKAKEKASNQMDTRIPLLMKCCARQDVIVQAVIHHLTTKLKLPSAESDVGRLLLLQFYFQIPKSIKWISNHRELFKDIQYTVNTPSEMDIVSHRLLTALANTDHGKQCDERMRDVNIACRKMAAVHPILFLKQLPLLAGLLHGRIDLVFSEFKARHHLALFLYILDLLELLIPHVFSKEYTALADVLQSYFSLLKNYGFEHAKLGGLISRFIRFLHQFLAYDLQRAAKIIRNYVSIIGDLSLKFPDMSSLKALLLLSAIALPTPDKYEGEAETSSSSKEEGNVITIRPNSPYSSTQLAPLQRILASRHNAADVANVLRQLDEISQRKIDILENFKGDVKRLLMDPDDECRNIALILMLRHLQHDPSSCHDFLPAYLLCLDSDNYEVVLSALKHLSEFVLLSQEYTTILLQKVFSVGITTSIDTSSYITETVQLIHMQKAM